MLAAIWDTHFSNCQKIAKNISMHFKSSEMITNNHDRLIAKLHCYVIEDDSLKVLWNYLKNRWQRTKLNASCYMGYHRDLYSDRY